MVKQAIKFRISQLLVRFAAQTGPRFEKRLVQTMTLAALLLQKGFASLATESKHQKCWLVVITITVVAVAQTSHHPLLQTMEFVVRTTQFEAVGQRVLWRLAIQEM